MPIQESPTADREDGDSHHRGSAPHRASAAAHRGGAKPLDQPVRTRLPAAVEDHLAALVLRRYVAAMADGGADIKDGLDLLALEALRLLGGTARGRVVFALRRLEHRDGSTNS